MKGVVDVKATQEKTFGRQREIVESGGGRIEGTEISGESRLHLPLTDGAEKEERLSGKHLLFFLEV